MEMCLLLAVFDLLTFTVDCVASSTDLVWVVRLNLSNAELSPKRYDIEGSWEDETIPAATL